MKNFNKIIIVFTLSLLFYNYFVLAQITRIPRKPDNLSPKRPEVGYFPLPCIEEKCEWDNVNHATKYQVQFGNSDFCIIYKDTIVTETFVRTEILRDIITEQRHFYGKGSYERYWRVRAGNNYGWSAWNEDGYLHGISFPTAPVKLLHPSNRAIGEYSALEWKAEPNATGYSVLINDQPDFTEPLFVSEKLFTNTTSYWPTGLVEGTTYYWCVVSYSSCNLDLGAKSNIWSFKAYCPQMTQTPLFWPTNDLKDVTLPTLIRWCSVLGAEKYQLQIDDKPDFINPDIDAETTTNYYFALGLLDGVEYFWRVRPSISCRDGEWSQVWRFTTCNQPPMPTLINPSNGTFVDVSQNLEWHSDIMTTKYQLQVDDNIDFNSPVIDKETSDTLYSMSSLVKGASYFWRVRGFNGCDWGEWSTVSDFVTCAQLNIVTLQSPSNGATNEKLRPLLEWWKVTGATKYQVQVNVNSIFRGPIKDKEITSGYSTYKIMSGLLDGTTYYWRVRSFNGCDWGPWSTVFNFTTGYEKPRLVSPKNLASLNIFEPIDLEWEWEGSRCSDESLTSRYVVQIAENQNFYNLFRVIPADGNRIRVSGLEAEKLYYWRVKARFDETEIYLFGIRHKCLDTQWSDYNIFRTFCPIIDAPRLSLPRNNQTNVNRGRWVYFNWSDITNAVKYQIQVDDNSDFSSPEIDIERRDSDYYDNQLIIGKKYYWKVRCYERCGWSDWSMIWNFTP